MKLLEYYALQRIEMICYAARGRNFTFHIDCDVNSTSRRRALYTSHETKVQFRPFAAYHIFRNTDK